VAASISTVSAALGLRGRASLGGVAEQAKPGSSKSVNNEHGRLLGTGSRIASMNKRLHTPLRGPTLALRHGATEALN
jgi:hypothetical protein